MPDYAWICWKILDYAKICGNIPKSTWMAFVLQSPLQSLVYLNMCNVLILQKFIVWRNIRLFPWRNKIWFFLWYPKVFDLLLGFRLNIFTSKIQSFLLSLGFKGPGGPESWYVKLQYSVDYFAADEGKSSICGVFIEA